MRGRRYANDDKIWGVAARKRVRKLNFKFSRPGNAITHTEATTVVNADSTEQQSVIQKYLRARARTRDRLIMLYILMEADSTEQLSLIQEYKDLANLPLMGKGEDQIDDSMDSVYNREEK